MQDLNIGHLTPAREALERIPVVPPDREDNLIIALSWLLEPAEGFTPEHLADWLAAWKRGVLSLLDKDQILPEFRLLVGACIQWPEDWSERHSSDASALQETITSSWTRSCSPASSVPGRASLPNACRCRCSSRHSGAFSKYADTWKSAADYPALRSC